MNLAFNGKRAKPTNVRNLLIATVFSMGIVFVMKFRGLAATSVAGLFLAIWMWLPCTIKAEDRLIWKPDSVAAEISSWELGKLLQKLSEATGWEIYVDPEARQTIST